VATLRHGLLLYSGSLCDTSFDPARRTKEDGNEAEVGQVYKEVFGTGKRQREDVFICSKLWNSSHHPERVSKAFSKTLNVRVHLDTRRISPC